MLLCSTLHLLSLLAQVMCCKINAGAAVIMHRAAEALACPIHASILSYFLPAQPPGCMLHCGMQHQNTAVLSRPGQTICMQPASPINHHGVSCTEHPANTTAGTQLHLVKPARLITHLDPYPSEPNAFVRQLSGTRILHVGSSMQVAGSMLTCAKDAALGKSSGAIQGRVPRMLPLTKVVALRLLRPMSAILTTGLLRSRRSPRRFSVFTSKCTTWRVCRYSSPAQHVSILAHSQGRPQLWL